MQRLAALALCAAALLGCKTKEKFPTLGTAVASPIDVAVSEDGAFFYVLNSDFDRTYNAGSVLVLDKDGNKVTAVEIPRMGRSLTVAGTDLIVTVDYPDEKEDAHVLLFDISDAANPVLRRDFEIECSPFNAVAEKGYPYFFVSCLSGALFQGQFGEPREGSVLKEVRYYGISRRAMFLDTKRNLLLGFTTDTSKQSLQDRELDDARTFNALAVEQFEGDQPVPDEVPDDFQENKRVAGNKSQRQNFQFFVYDIAKEKENAPGCTVAEDETCSFPYRSNADPIVDSELRWIYYRLTNFDGAPDLSDRFAEAQVYKYYRTNFYDAKKDPADSDVFYLSHRGNPDKSPFANQIVRVTITGDLHVRDEDLKAPKTSDVMTFERVYGFKGAQATKYVFPGDFEIQDIAGQKTVIVNNFRDLINWVRKDTYFSLGAQVLDDTSWFAETYQYTDPETGDVLVDTEANQEAAESFFQVAVNAEGRTMSCSFYGNAVLLLDVKPGIGISEPKRIE